MIPRLDNLSDFPHFTTTDGVSGVAFKFKTFDLESTFIEESLKAFQSWIASLEPQVLVRVTTEACALSFHNSQVPRAMHLAQLEVNEYETIISLEVRDPKLINLLRMPNKSLSLLKQAARSLDQHFSIEPLSQKRLKELFIDSPNEFIQRSGQISKGDGHVGIVRLWKSSSFELSEESLGKLFGLAPKPLKVVCTFKKVDRSVAQAKLERLLKQYSSGASKASQTKATLTEDFLTETSLNGASLFKFELLFVLERKTQEQLASDLQQLRELCQSLGDAMIEGVGVAPSFVASLPGSAQHVPILESNENLTLFTPVSRYGDGDKFTGEERRALSLHRKDSSLTNIDILSTQHQNANCVIVGSSGRGKSVFLGSLTHSLLNDQNVSVIKVDVGGSHSKECEMLGGVEYKLSIDQPSNLNPFAVLQNLKQQDHEFVRAVLGKFLETLILEEGETKLSKETRVEVDQALDSYIKLRPKNPTITDFYSKVEMPRKTLLSRFCKGGLYGNSFTTSSIPKESPTIHFHQLDPNGDGFPHKMEFIATPQARSNEPHTRLRYYNFSQVFQASDTDFAQAGMAAVLAQFNLEMRTNPGRRLVLVCDETPFFIEKCFEFFKFSTANVRKFGASVVLVVQVSGHLTVKGDSSVIENSFHRFLFSVDGEPQKYRNRFNLSDSQYSKIKDLKFSRTHGSELLYKSGDDAKVLNLKLTAEEYWRVTSSQSDRLKLEKILSTVEGLKLNEAIGILAKAEASP